RLEPRVRLEVDAAEHRDRERWADDHRAVAAHERHGAAVERLRERPAERRAAHEHVGHAARRVADVEERHALPDERAHVVERPERSRTFWSARMRLAATRSSTNAGSGGPAEAGVACAEARRRAPSTAPASASAPPAVKRRLVRAVIAAPPWRASSHHPRILRQ